MPTVNDLTDPGEIETTEPGAPVKGASTLAGVVADLGFTALFAWVGGVALNHGFGVSVPFTAAWLLLLVGLYLLGYVTGQLASAWHKARVEADIHLIAATMAAQEAIQQQPSGLGGLADFLKTLDSDDKTTSPYL